MPEDWECQRCGIEGRRWIGRGGEKVTSIPSSKKNIVTVFLTACQEHHCVRAPRYLQGTPLCQRSLLPARNTKLSELHATSQEHHCVRVPHYLQGTLLSEFLAGCKEHHVIRAPCYLPGIPLCQSSLLLARNTFKSPMDIAPSTSLP